MKLSQEALGYMGDDELHRRYRNITNLIRGNRTSEEKRHELEIEHSYICREIEVRRNRHIAHERWLRDNPNVGSNYYDHEYDNSEINQED